MTMVDTEVTAIPAAKGDRSHGHGCEGEPQPRLRAAASAAKGNRSHGCVLQLRLRRGTTAMACYFAEFWAS